ncbi:hypothetical protein AOLI_G00057480 [Acnodon oligacanthus]
MHSSFGTQRHQQIPQASEESRASPDTSASQIPHRLPREGERIEGLVQMDPDLVRMEQGQSRNRSIKAKWPGRRNPVLHGRAVRGYQINLTLLLE